MTRFGNFLVLPVSLCLLGAGCRSAVDSVKPAGAVSAPAAATATPMPMPPAEAPADAQPPAGAAPVYKNTISWSTASEHDNFGFDIYRSQDPEGPFIRLNKSPVEGAGTVDEPRSYEWVDATIDPRQTYYYYVESISMAGVRERFTPVGKADPKIPPAVRDTPSTPAGR